MKRLERLTVMPEDPIPCDLCVLHAADTIGIGKDLLFDIIRRRNIPTYRLGYYRMVPMEHVESLRAEYAIQRRNDLLTMTQASRRLGYDGHRTPVVRIIQNGALEEVRSLGRVFVTLASLEALEREPWRVSRLETRRHERYMAAQAKEQA